MTQLALGYYLGCAISMIAICCAESHEWKRSILYTVISPILTPLMLIGITIDKVRRGI